MTDPARKLLHDVLGLPQEDCVRIATELLGRLDGPPDADWEEAWAAELEMRQQAARDRGARAPEWPEARARTQARRDRSLAEIAGLVAARVSGDSRRLRPIPRTS
jgi:hypothetical protein